jgi:hypothetical protein
VNGRRRSAREILRFAQDDVKKKDEHRTARDDVKKNKNNIPQLSKNKDDIAQVAMRLRGSG